MASLEQIRLGVKTTLEANIATLHGFSEVPDSAKILPCVIVMPTAADFLKAMGKGTDRWDFDLYVLAAYADAGIGQNSLDSFVTGAGVKSIRSAIFANPTLGLSGTHAHIASMSNYGSTFDVAAVAHIGATLQLVVYTPGTA